MRTDFCWANSRMKARPELDGLLDKGEDMVAIACAYCTDAGVALLEKHVARLNLPESFLVVSASPPTDLCALQRLHELTPGKIYVHFGARSPEEIGFGSPLMHSKVFLARSGRACWLWVGSHNLTGNATQGLNMEAAIKLQGDIEEKPFVDALAHLRACRDEAVPYSPDMCQDRERSPCDILAIHAEAADSRIPPRSFCQLCVPSTEFDSQFNVGAGVVIYLYPIGFLRANGPNPSRATAAYRGQSTALNNSPKHPENAGRLASWRESQYLIEEEGGVFTLFPARAPNEPIVTQFMIRVDGRDDSAKDILFLSQHPSGKAVFGKCLDIPAPIDEDMRQFFEPAGPVAGGSFIRLNRLTRYVVKVAESDQGRYGASLLSDFGVEGVRAKSVQGDLLQSPKVFVFRARCQLKRVKGKDAQ